MLSSRRDEIAHILVRDALGVYPSEERRRALHCLRPFEYILISAGNLAAGPLRRDAKKVSIRRNGTYHAPRDLGGDVLIDTVPRRECNIPLRLNFEDGVAGRPCARSDQVIQLKSVLGALKSDADDPGVWHTRCSIARQQGEQIESTKFAFDISTSRPSRGRA
ncbi:hypothetical protein D3C85_1193000 [compost metagenome]